MESKSTSRMLQLVLTRRRIKKNCPKCQTALRFREFRAKTFIGLKGKFTVERPHFECKNCKESGYFDDEQAGRKFGRLSPRLTEQVCLLAAQMPAVTCVDILRRICNLRVSITTVKDAMRFVGGQFYTEEEISSAEHQLPNFDFNQKETQDILKNRAYLQIDGSMLNSLDGWKENKLATIYSEADTLKRGKGKNVRLSILRKTLVTSFAKGLDDFEKRVSYWLRTSKKIFAKQLIVVSDGAVWIENLTKRIAPTAIHILDWYHAKEKIYNCAKELFGDLSPKVAAWAEPICDHLWEGRVDFVIDLLQNQATIQEKSTPIYSLRAYFSERRTMLRYDEFRASGYTIGSGAIESANKYAIQDRLKKSGMRWSIPGANAVAKLRTLYLSNLWDTHWAAA